MLGTKIIYKLHTTAAAKLQFYQNEVAFLLTIHCSLFICLSIRPDNHYNINYNDTYHNNANYYHYKYNKNNYNYNNDYYNYNCNNYNRYHYIHYNYNTNNNNCTSMQLWY